MSDTGEDVSGDDVTDMNPKGEEGCPYGIVSGDSKDSNNEAESEDMDVQTDDQSSDEFFILSKDSQNNTEDERGNGSDDEVDKEYSIIHSDVLDTARTADDSVNNSEEEEKEFSVIREDVSDACREGADKDSCDSSAPQDLLHPGLEGSDQQRTMDMYVNGSPRRQRRAYSRHKARRIENLLQQDPVDVSELRQQAISHGGLLNAELRRRVWPFLLNVNTANIAPKPEEEVLKGHRDYQQVVLDVNRSIKRFPPGMEETHRLSLQDKLVDVIMRVLVRHPELHYYQGFHDICVTFLLVVDEDMAFALVEKLSLSHLRDFLEPTMERTQQLLDYVPPLIRRANPELLQYMEGAELGNVFCISWLLTWFGHVLSDIESILRIFDFFIACHPLMPVYVMGAVVLHREKEIFATEQEMPALYQLLNKVPDNLPFEHLLSNAGDLYLQYPPTELANEAVQRFKRAQEQAAVRKAQILARQQHARLRKSPSFLPDGNVTFGQVTFWMLGAVVSVAAYALLQSLDWNWTFSS
ncbi:TBC1 domain family member 20-like isoform X2 [Babylonia areolata]